MSYKTYGRAVRIVRKMPYPIRLLFWVLLFYYNRKKYKDSNITLELYKSYAR